VTSKRASLPDRSRPAPVTPSAPTSGRTRAAGPAPAWHLRTPRRAAGPGRAAGRRRPTRPGLDPGSAGPGPPARRRRSSGSVAASHTSAVAPSGAGIDPLGQQRLAPQPTQVVRRSRATRTKEAPESMHPCSAALETGPPNCPCIRSPTVARGTASCPEIAIARSSRGRQWPCGSHQTSHALVCLPMMA
jgi:hypothetical protein